MDFTESDNKKLLLDHAAHILARRLQSVFEMKYKLGRFAKRRHIQDGEKLVTTVIDDMLAQDILNDETFAQWYAQERLDFKQISKLRLRKELAQKGVARDLISRVMESYDEELACRTLSLRKKHMDMDKLKSYLQRQGFPYSLVEDVLAVADRF